MVGRGHQGDQANEVVVLGEAECQWRSGVRESAEAKKGRPNEGAWEGAIGLGRGLLFIIIEFSMEPIVKGLFAKRTVLVPYYGPRW